MSYHQQDTLLFEEAPDTQLTVASHLRKLLIHLSTVKVPQVIGPSETKGKRASVAVVIRLNPHPDHDPSRTTNSPRRSVEDSFYDIRKSDAQKERAPNGSSSLTQPDLETFFDTQWTKFADAECLFIKRSAREGDRWQGHVALPGGKRDLEDESDKAAAIRECYEEVGLNIDSEHAIYCGPLPERVVMANMAANALMVLCPYVFILTSPEVPTLKLQPSEVAAAFWVPFRALVHPSFRTFEGVDVSKRIFPKGYRIQRWFHNLMFGKMYCSAIQLAPSISIYSSIDRSFLPVRDAKSDKITKMERIWRLIRLDAVDSTKQTTLISEKRHLLWGLSYGVLADILELLPPYETLESFDYPFFAQWDYILWARLLSWEYHTERKNAIEDGWWRKTDVEVDTEPDALVKARRNPQEGRDKSSGIHYILSGYYKYIRQAGTLTMMGRLVIFAGFCWLNYRSGWMISIKKFRGVRFVRLMGGLVNIGWTKRPRM